MNAAEKSLDRIQGQSKSLDEPKTPDTSPELEQLNRIAEISPRAAIIEAWRLIEDAAGRSGFVQGAAIPRINAALYVRWLVREGKIPVDSEETFDALRNLKNEVAHTYDAYVSTADAQRYLRLAARATQLIQSTDPANTPS